MVKLGFSRVLDCLGLSGCPSSACFCINSIEDQDDIIERTALVEKKTGGAKRIKDLVDGNKTLGFHLKPKTVVLRVSMHCGGCARKVEKHISKIEGVTSFEVDLESKKVVVKGDITPFEVLESLSRTLKNVELWTPPY